MLAYYLHDLSPHAIRFTEKFAIHWYGLSYVLGFYLCYRVMLFLARRGLTELKEAEVADFITLVAIFGVVLGGRLGYMLWYNPSGLIHEPWTFFLLNQGGMASHGGILAISIFTLWYARRHKISWVGLGDTLVCGAPLGVFLGRIANFINGELFGRVTTVPWAVKFPTELHHSDYEALGGPPVYVPQQIQHSPDIIAWFTQNVGDVSQLEAMLHPRHPSQLYEALGEGLLLSAILLFTRIRYPKLPHGILTAMFFLLYSAARISLEFVRQPDSGSDLIFGMTMGQFLTLFMVAAGIAFLIHALRQKRIENS
jgi:phosphatidylglycerol---prolipoprotein diacylglyceryl transferase